MELHACVVSAGWMGGVHCMPVWCLLDGWVESTGWNYTPVWCLLDGWVESTG